MDESRPASPNLQASARTSQVAEPATAAGERLEAMKLSCPHRRINLRGLSEDLMLGGGNSPASGSLFTLVLKRYTHTNALNLAQKSGQIHGVRLLLLQNDF